MVKKKENGMPVRNDDKHKLLFRVPANDEGRKFVEDFREYINKGVYKLRVLYTGKRPKGTPHATTLKENADSIRGYVDIDCSHHKEYISQYDELNDRISAFKKEKSELKTIIGQQMAVNKQLKEDLDALNSGMSEWSPYHKEVRKQLREREDEVEQLKNKLDAKQNELKLEITAHTMMREERDKLKDERDNPHGKTYELSVSDCECQGCPPKIGECDCRDSLPLVPEYNCYTEINKLKEERDELDKLCMSQQVEIDRLDMKIDNEVCEGSCVSQEDYNSVVTENIALNKSLAKAYEEVIALKESHSKLEEVSSVNGKISEEFRHGYNQTIKHVLNQKELLEWATTKADIYSKLLLTVDRYKAMVKVIEQYKVEEHNDKAN